MCLSIWGCSKQFLWTYCGDNGCHNILLIHQISFSESVYSALATLVQVAEVAMFIMSSFITMFSLCNDSYRLASVG